jgi:hypothetical protein
VGTPHKSTSGPFQGPAQHSDEPIRWPFPGPRPAATTGYSDQSQGNSSRPIKGQLILTNHGRYTNPADRIKGDRMEPIIHSPRLMTQLLSGVEGSPKRLIIVAHVSMQHRQSGLKPRVKQPKCRYVPHKKCSAPLALAFVKFSCRSR